ncbi:hypothetical protein NLG97_g1842 [Lecanicillium saksenae]|uniref:Uncharacterized protein n=1 Tax=Lecanicillium saksenae TaxID=468837 RepID=A0ACC1R3V8_9HYPO|nr:hypothetical protein NLG97_g1842 [Lecanicillium saksenae]
MTDTAPAPNKRRRRSFLSRLFGKKSTHDKASDAILPSYDSSTKAQHSTKTTVPQSGATPRSHLNQAEEYIKDEETKFRNRLDTEEEALSTREGALARNYVHEVENAAHKEAENIEGDWKEAQKAQTASDKYVDLV